MSENPFIPGARVAVGEKYGDGVTEGFVEKVHKSGRFTLKGSAQQWKPWKSTWSSGPRWSATETGTGWGRRSLDIWDDETDKEITARIDAHKARLKWRDLRSKLSNVREPTVALCDAVEAALALTRPERKP